LVTEDVSRHPEIINVETHLQHLLASDGVWKLASQAQKVSQLLRMNDQAAECPDEA
jgi:hypothetical protein